MDSIADYVIACSGGRFSVPIAIDTWLPYALRNHDEAHDLAHAKAVFATACIIAADKELSADEMAMFAITMLCHDVRDYKMKNALSAEEVEAFYAGMLGSDAAAQIVHIHTNCSWSARDRSRPAQPDTLRLILQDADWIEAIDVPRCIVYTRTVRPDLSPAALAALVSSHIREKLLHIPARLNFDVSRALAAGRVAHLHEYLAEHS